MQARVRNIKDIMEQHFPLHLAEKWDNAGLQIGSLNGNAAKVMVALDLDETVAQKAYEENADMIITHHPLIFKPVKKINFDTPAGKLLRDLIKADISVYSAHTNLDAGERGLNQLLAEMLGLQNIKPLEKSWEDSLYKLVVFVPVSHVDKVREAINDAGAGYIGKYSDCSYRVQGTGTFRPEEGTNPFIGEKGVLEEVDEFRLETVVYEHDLDQAIQAMIKAHPYEEVAYDIYSLKNQGKIYSLGRKGKLASSLTLREYAQEVKKCLGLESIRVVGNLDSKVRNIAVVSGAGASFIGNLQRHKVDVLVTGDVKYHEARDAEALGIAIIDAGHQGTEEIMVNHLCELLKHECQIRGYETQFIPVYMTPCFQQI
ncbi:MAG: Nif3-like dinuclear metal center hexameric protein [Syntrophomonadaceae bacterium]|nr:Nif3-like dinuclear metal center hexameric protein [Syntrophomonadaceae bacterium]MDD3888951.1 Nif3-like dinuclear metal center hexameric protein [Syntrophomonadaceae bacterium]MDD4548691.1 Nif3-like dinuclear metal center hexameric protein [Syntrophomonadaceae bacterium]